MFIKAGAGKKDHFRVLLGNKRLKIDEIYY
jgi:hypothetical protein